MTAQGDTQQGAASNHSPVHVGATATTSLAGQGLPSVVWQGALAGLQEGLRLVGPEEARFREELGLPRAGPIVMSGHQPSLWHPGIAAKLFATRALARAIGATPAWLVVDTDELAPLTLRIPTAPDEQGRIGAMELRLDGRSAPTIPALQRISPAAVRALRVPTDALDRAHPCVREPLAALAQTCERGELATARASTGATLAELSTGILRATPGLAEAFAGVAIVYASELARTSAFAQLAEHLRQSAELRSAYDDSTRQHPAARMRPLRPGELPLWRVEGARRVPALLSDDVDSRLLPRAIITTLLLRGLGCELFVHGLGGGVYDRVLEAWHARARSTGGTPLVADTLARAAVVSGTLRLPLGSAGEQPRFGAHHKALHTPALLGDGAAQHRKDELVRAIASTPRGSVRSGLFRRLHALLAEVRASHEATLAALHEQDAASRMLAGSAALAQDRTWSCVLHTPDALARLRSAVEAVVQRELSAAGRFGAGSVQPRGEGTA
jgi:hypothetical protein